MTNGDPPGKKPSARTKVLQQAAEALSPTRSIERIEATARGVIAGVSATAVVLTGFGLLGSKDVLGPRTELIPAAVFSAAALVLAAWALIPSVRRTRSGNLLATQQFFEEQIRKRGRLSRLAAIALALSYVSALIPILSIEPNDPPPRAVLAFTPAEGTKAVKLLADPGPVVEGGGVTLRVDAVANGKRTEIRNLSQRQLEGEGMLEVSTVVRRPRRNETLEAELTRKDDNGKVTLRTRLTLVGTKSPPSPTTPSGG